MRRTARMRLANVANVMARRRRRIMLRMVGRVLEGYGSERFIRYLLKWRFVIVCFCECLFFSFARHSKENWYGKYFTITLNRVKVDGKHVYQKATDNSLCILGEAGQEMSNFSVLRISGALCTSSIAILNLVRVEYSKMTASGIRVLRSFTAQRIFSLQNQMFRFFSMRSRVSEK